ncbi:heterokaryon incompatibility protein-domain-containing protein [Neofusicoccum parvum]|nr:heterokaryon incompatibility protein-domain-containing protein [Neofusicoccum parvum]
MGRHLHVYKPLADERAYIRLVLLQPDIPSDKIHIYLQHTLLQKFTSGESGGSLENELKALSSPREKAASDEEPGLALYEALSYTWGDQRGRKSVDIGPDGVKDIGANLEEALRHLRREDEVRVLWIDALSINQDDNKEKSAQVPLMGDIFRSTSRVVMWLGAERDESTYALDLMRGLGSNIEVDWFHIKMKASDEALSDPSWTDEPFDDVEPHPLHALFMRPWFDRLWIRQEVFLASRDSILCCGLDELDWSVFCKAVFRIAAREIGKHRLGKEGQAFLKRVSIIVSICSPSPYDVLQLRQRLRPTK